MKISIEIRDVIFLFCSENSDDFSAVLLPRLVLPSLLTAIDPFSHPAAINFGSFPSFKIVKVWISGGETLIFAVVAVATSFL